MKKFYVYVDYTNEEIPRPFYVGKGSINRVIKDHKARNFLHGNICKKYGYTRKIFLETFNEHEAFQKEIELIALFKTYFYEQGSWGANFTPGGEGVSGRTPQHTKDPLWIEKMREVSKKRWEDDEYRALLKKTTTGKKRSEASKARMKKSQERIKDDPNHIKKCRDSAIKRFENLEESEKASNRMKEKWKDPEYRKMIIESRKNGKSNKKVKNDN